MEREIYIRTYAPMHMVVSPTKHRPRGPGFWVLEVTQHRTHPPSPIGDQSSLRLFLRNFAFFFPASFRFLKTMGPVTSGSSSAIATCVASSLIPL